MFKVFNMSKKLISFDYAMKYILRDKSDYSIIEGFLSALLATANYKPVKIKAFLETDLDANRKWGRFILADMIVEDADGVQYIIELERNERDNVTHKMYFSSNRSIVNSVEEQSTFKIAKVIHVVLMYFDIGRNDLCHGKAIVHGNTEEFLDLQLKHNDGSSYDLHDISAEYFLISIPAFSDEINHSIDEWLYMMKHQEIRDDFKEKDVKLAAERLQSLKMTVGDYNDYLNYKIKMFDIHDVLNTAYIKGKEEGLKEAREKKQI